MTLVAGNVIDAARDRHPSFYKEKHPNKMLLRFLSAYAKGLHGKIAAIDEDQLRVDVTATLPLASFDAGIALPANVRSITGAVVSYPEPTTFAPVPIDIIQSDERNARNTPAGAAWQVNGKLYLAGNADRWSAFNQIAISLILLPDTLQTLADVLAVPDAAELACIENCALFLARREFNESDGDTKLNLSTYVGAAADAERAFLDDVKNNVAGRTFYTLDVRDL